MIFTGHKKYLGFLYLYSTYNNAVIHVFIKLLRNSVANNEKKPGIQMTDNLMLETISAPDSKRPGNNGVELAEVEPLDNHDHSILRKSGCPTS